MRTLILSFALLCGLAPPADAQQTNRTERWRGTITMGVTKIEFLVAFDGGGRGTIDIPQQGVKDAPLAKIQRTAKRLSFEFVAARASFELTPAAGGRTASGKLRQSGVVCDVRMVRVEGKVSIGPRRPQTPKPPFPYAERKVVIKHGKPMLRIAGTLTLPEGKGRHPAVILITGSGAQDRDETIAAHKPFLVIADHLTRRGIAVLRLDDRGVGGSTGNLLASTTRELATDIRAALRFLRGVDEIDDDRIGLIGHSEGAVIAPIVAAAEPQVGAIVLLAGFSVTGGELLRIQLAAILRASGVAEEQIALQDAAQQKILDCMSANRPEEDLRAAITELIRLQTGKEAKDPVVTAQVRAQMMAHSSRWFRHFVALDPKDALAQVRCPVLALNGELDLQVPHELNLREIAAALAKAGNDDVTTRAFPGLNHLFQTATTGLPAEYAQIEETIAPAVLEMMTEWLQARLRSKDQKAPDKRKDS